MTVQHEYRGSGSPVGTVLAPVNSHYLDLTTEETWFCVYSDVDSSRWRRMAVGVPIELGSGTVTLLNEYIRQSEMILQAGTLVQFEFGGPIYSNVALGGEILSFTAASLSHMKLERVDAGGYLLIVTPLTEYN
ncbi:hypothetical protein [Pseudomonas sp. EggHat1]|uniref:hypothetical protein n=1 Tax=Pseudomonas sp. EggHat1 TaxID=2761624 RepID=UPI00186950C5|nr:hypothetical protein [Pseudomonas sp. EggHat1]